MNLYAVSFFGHRQIDNVFAIEQRLETLIRELLTTKEYVEFLVGRDGEFDQLVSSTVRRCKRAIRDDNSALVLVLPYTKVMLMILTLLSLQLSRLLEWLHLILSKQPLYLMQQLQQVVLSPQRPFLPLKKQLRPLVLQP